MGRTRQLEAPDLRFAKATRQQQRDQGWIGMSQAELAARLAIERAHARIGEVIDVGDLDYTQGVAKLRDFLAGEDQTAEQRWTPHYVEPPNDDDPLEDLGDFGLQLRYQNLLRDHGCRSVGDVREAVAVCDIARWPRSGETTERIIRKCLERATRKES